MQSLERKKFVLYYKPIFPGGEDVKLVEGMPFFTEDKGYKPSDIGDISRLEKFDSLNLTLLMIWRVK